MRQFTQPAKILPGLLNPEHTGMFAVRRFIGRVIAFFVQRGAHQLHAFENHFDHVLIAVISRAAFDVGIQHKNVHD